MMCCYAVAGGSGLAVNALWGLPGVMVWLVVCLVLGWLFAPDGWDY